MHKLLLPALLAGAAALAGCATAPPPVVAAGNACATGSIDANGDGAVTSAEWNGWRATGYSYWDTNKDNRIDRSEFQACYMAGGFYPASAYNSAYWDRYWTAFDANGDGFLSADEYWSTRAWSTIDRNGNGIIDSAEWTWW